MEGITLGKIVLVIQIGPPGQQSVKRHREAATGAPTHGRIEIGVNTAESHRRRGLSSIACAYLIEACEAKGFSTWWDCAKQNIASTYLARKLGYQNEREYRYVWWRRPRRFAVSRYVCFNHI